MIFKLHYWFLTSGACAIGILMGVFVETYTDASSLEIGALYMLMPFIGIVSRPIICAMADRRQAHQKYIMVCLFMTAISYLPFVVIPLLGPAVYAAHGRLCWYSLVFLKVIGDIAFGGVISIGDSLAINYAKRIGTDFSVYRVWGTLSWMTFGLIIGQINELPVLPKYVPGFLILIASTLLDMTVIWLWPPEYFVMVAQETTSGGDNKRPQTLEGADKQANEPTSDRDGKSKAANSKLGAMTKSLMPKEVVWAHIKGKLLSVVCCGTRKIATTSNQLKQLNNNNNNNSVSNQFQASQANSDNCSNKSVPVDCKQQQQQQQHAINLVISEKQSPATLTVVNKGDEANQLAPIDKRIQFKILYMLFRRDPRICLYLVYFVIAGMSIVPISFFFMNLSKICHEQGTCAFSQLGGMLQASMAVCETMLFIYIKRIKAKIGRVNTCVLSLFLVTIKYTFYGTVYSHVSPYYAIILEGIHGVCFGIFLTMMVELGHEFASEVQFLIPDLIDQGIVKEEAEADRLKLSLSATMQALVASANDGLGRGVGALIYGLILESYTYETLWFIIGVSAGVCCLITIAISVLDRVFDFQLGLDVADKRSCSYQLDLEDLSRKESLSSQKANSINSSAA